MTGLDFKELFKLMRPQQWFKSFSILFGASVVIYEMQTIPFMDLILAFLGVSLLSSSVYAFNDVADYEKDKEHPVKKHRPIASGLVSQEQGLILGLVLIILSFSIFYYLNPRVLVPGLLMLVNNVMYSFEPFRLKDIPIMDVISAGLNFSLRVMIGWYALTSEPVYNIVVLFPFFIAGFLLSCKRFAEYKFLKDKAGEVREVYNYYNETTLSISINVYLTLSVLGYYLFAEVFNKTLFLIGPWFFIQMYWYKSFLEEEGSVVKKPEDVFLERKKFTLAGVLFTLVWLLIVLIS